MSLAPGGRLGPYEIVAPLGSGGMGEVYRARDTRLGRDVAIKVLPAERLSDEHRRARFVQEARTVAALNHPHIVTIHEIESAEGTDFIVMELVPGKTLDALIPRHGMRLGEVLRIAIPLADALAAAHGAGIVHRDLKPANVMVTPEGVVKVLDFGLAKLTQAEESAREDATTLDAREKLSHPGTVAGTPAYMSPEQASGGTVDARSDVFAFGAVLYEMVTGRRPFGGGSTAEMLASLLKEQPKPPSEVVPDVPKELERIILRCLRKEPGRRFQHMVDVRVELQEVKEESDSQAVASAAASTSRSRWRRPAWIVAGVTVLALATVTMLWPVRRKEPPTPRVVQLTSLPGSEESPALSPDGRQVAFVWTGEKRDNADIYVQMIGGDRPLRLTTDPADDTLPAWSADGREIAFRRVTSAGAAVYIVSALGGPERKVADLGRVDANWPSLSWTPDAKGLVTVDSDPREGEGIYLIPLGPGERRRLTPKPEYTQSAPSLSPDGRLLAYTDCTAKYRCVLQVQRLGAGYAPEGPPRPLIEAGMVLGLAWSRDSRSLIYSGRDFYLQRVSLSDPSSPERVEVAGRLAVGPTVAGVGNRLAFARDTEDSDIWRVTEGAAPVSFVSSTRRDNQPRYSPDGRRLAFCSNRSSEVVEVFVSASDGSTPMQLTHGPGLEQCSPTWSPDGRRITFDSQGKDAHWHVYVIDAAGGNPRLLTPSPADENVPLWSRDGRWIYFASNRTGRFEIWRAPAEGGDAVQITRAGGFCAEESADGRSLYYVKRESGSQPVFALSVAGGEERQILDSVWSMKAVAPVESGVYHLARRADGRPGAALRFLANGTGASRDLAQIDTYPDFGLTVSPDHKTILYAAWKPGNSDLFLIENFR